MDCDCEITPLEVETESAIYEIVFGQIQIEITGRCNQRCRHCRAANDLKRDMPTEQILKVINFARRYSPSYKEILLSGGEPLMHDDFASLLAEVRSAGGDFVTITTNGTIITKEHMDLFRDLAFQRLTLSVSLDSLDPAEHDDFRQYEGAYESAMTAIKLINSMKFDGLISSVRSTLRPHLIPRMLDFAKFAYEAGCDRLSFSAIHPAGRAIDQQSLWMSTEEKRRFIESIYELKGQFPESFNVTTNDPLKCIVRGFSDVGGDNERVFDGCPAAAVTFNVNANGNMTPCALLDIPMMNVFGMSIDQIAEAYSNSEIVKNMLDMNLTGKCGSCDQKYQCGGCRARAFARNGDYLAEDPDCWR